MTRFHLNLSLMTPGHFRQAWRLPGADPLAYLDIDFFRRLARIAEEARIDAVFLGDGPALRGEIEDAPGTGIDPLILLPHLAAITERLGVIITCSTTYNSPYNLARRFQALDIVTKGRAAVNIVTTGTPAAAANFGLDEHPTKETRYRRAHEFLDVVTRLWDSWSPGAIIADKATGVYADPARIRQIGHQGEFFSVAGPLPVPPGPQGRPVIVQAGGSEGGLRLAGDFADVVFTVAQTRAKAVAFRDEIRRRAAAAGRHPDSIKVSLGVVVLVAETEQEARRREQDLYDTLPIERLTAGLLHNLGLPPGSFGPDDPVSIVDLPETIPVTSFSTGFSVSTRALLAEEGPRTPRELVQRGAGGAGHRLLVGSAEQVADDLQAWFEAGTADGFTVMPADTSADFENFSRLVVPILQRRGLFQTEYSAPTLRGRLGLPAPPAPSQPAGRRATNAATAAARPGKGPAPVRARFTLLLTRDGVHPGTLPRGATGAAHALHSRSFSDWLPVAREAERAGIDALFVADAPAASPEAPPDHLEPITFLAALARETTSIGLVATASTSFNEPYNVVRQFASLNRISNGRAGWNSVGTSRPGAAENFGDTRWSDHDRRYRIGHEFTEVVRKLWAAGDRPINHVGEYFSVRGPLNVAVSEADRPVVAQAGGSPEGIRLAARFADLTFANVADIEASSQYVRALRAAEAAAGRTDPPLLALPGVVPYLADTEAEAQEYKAALDNAIDLVPRYAVVARYLHLDTDTLRALALDDPFPLELLATPDQVDNSVATFAALRTVIEKTRPSVRELLVKASGGNRHREFVGTPEAFAADVETWIRAGAADGFTLLLPDTRRDLSYFADRVTPVLRDRAAIPEHYAGGGLRAQLGLR